MGIACRPLAPRLPSRQRGACMRPTCPSLSNGSTLRPATDIRLLWWIFKNNGHALWVRLGVNDSWARIKANSFEHRTTWFYRERRRMGVEKEILRPGNGPKPRPGQSVTVHCIGCGNGSVLHERSSITLPVFQIQYRWLCYWSSGLVGSTQCPHLQGQCTW